MGLFKKEVKILYHDTDMTSVVKMGKGDWIDLRCQSVQRVRFEDVISIEYDNKDYASLARYTNTEEIESRKGLYSGSLCEYFHFKKGDFLLLNLGVSMELPKGYEALVAPRGSTFKNYGLIQTNSPGVIDNTYNGHNDVWFMPVYALRDGFIIKDERVCQFRILRSMPFVNFKSVTNLLKNVNRSGHGSSGTK